MIIPDLGGFVVNTIHSKRDGLATFYPPACELVFNRELTYNDGLLAESYMSIYDLTFEAAMWKINEDVSLIKQQLRDLHNVDLGKLGSFSINENNVFAYKSGSFVRPAYFGLTKASLKPLMQVQKPVAIVPKVADKSKRLRYAGVAAVAAVFLTLMMFVFPMSDTTIDRQSAKISYETEWFKSNNKSASSGELAVNDDVVAEAIVPESVANEDVAPKDIDVDEIVVEDLPRYYVVMGVFEINSGAERLVDILKDKGLTETDLIKRPGRYDVYAASFVNEESAKEYLKEIHRQFPAHSDAWILKR